MSITVTPQPSGFGADISGIDLRKPLSRQDRQDILQAWHRHQVVVFPDQDLSPAHLVAFAGHFGPFAKEPFVQPLSDQPQVIEVRREADEACIPFGASWHSDWSFLAKPPSATLLQSKVIPPVGGDTLFADSYRAYDTLDPDLKAQLRGLKALHSARRAYTPANYRAAGGDQRSMHIRPSEQAWAVQMHPLVRRHPATAKLCLWINPVYTVGICGLDHRVAQKLLDTLFEHALQTRFIYRHQWSTNMLVMWDNRCVQHRADGGYDGHQRLMHRTTIAGDIPR